MRRKSLPPVMIVFTTVVCAVVLLGKPSAAPQDHKAFLDQAGAQWELLNTYCFKCHNSTLKSGGIILNNLRPEDVPANAETWEKVVRKLRGRMMPPPGQPRPDEARYDSLVAWLEGYLDQAAPANANPGRVALHRLNRKEYANAVEDLLGIKIEPSEILPKDDKSDGFDNIASVLRASPAFVDQYVAAARAVALQAIGRPDAAPGSKAYYLPAEAEGKQAFHADGLPLGTRGGFAVEHFFPADGEYEINLANLFPGDLYFRGVEHENTLIVTLDGVKVHEIHIGGEEDLAAIDHDQSPAIDAMNARLKNLRFMATAGPHQVAATFLARTFAESDARLALLVPGGGQDRIIRITGFEIRGRFSTTGVSMTPSRRRVFICYPGAQAGKDEEEICARKILATIGRRAYRRTLTESDMAVLLHFYRTGLDAKNFEEGIRSGLTRILASPYFLYRNAIPDTQNVTSESIRRVSRLEMASRLAFFLWSSVPDDELLDLAEARQLHDPEILRKQVTRMLEDSRARTLTKNFAYQWLELSTLAEIEPDPTVFPFAANHITMISVDGDLRPELIEEVMLFVDSVFRENRSVLDLLTADYTYLNERVALHYGLNDVRGSRFRRVRLEDSARWGLLGKGAVLMASSYPNRTSPVRRGAWILENIIGTPPAPPPPDVKALLQDNPIGAKTFRTVRERLEGHRTQARCNSCHGVIDPLGLALENFDAVGTWRKIEMFAGTRIDASGELPDGTKLTGPDDLRNALMRKPDQFVQTLTEKLMTYALGRKLEYYDMPAVRAIVRDTRRDNYRFSSIVMGIVRSAPFNMEMAPEDDHPAAKRQ